MLKKTSYKYSNFKTNTMPIKILISLFLKLYMNIPKLLQKNNHAGKGMKRKKKKRVKMKKWGPGPTETQHSFNHKIMENIYGDHRTEKQCGNSACDKNALQNGGAKMIKQCWDLEYTDLEKDKASVSHCHDNSFIFILVVSKNGDFLSFLPLFYKNMFFPTPLFWVISMASWIL